MFRKRFNLMETSVKSSFKFKVREDPGWRRITPRPRRSIFRDPAALPMLEKIADALTARGFSVTKPKTGAACHGWFQVAFPGFRIMVVLLTGRKRGMVEFSIQSWPSQSLRQRWRTRAATSPDSSDWDQLCREIYNVISGEIKPESLQWTTFKEAERETRT
jgi:hypothetical protein